VGKTACPHFWNLIKGHFSHAIPEGERISPSRNKHGERGLWQRQFWAHLLCGQDDFNNPLDYIHWNPVKHGRVQRVVNWPHSSFHRFVERGVYPVNWGHPGERV